MHKMELPGRRQRGRAKRRFRDVVRDDMQSAGVREDAEDKERWRRMKQDTDITENDLFTHEMVLWLLFLL